MKKYTFVFQKTDKGYYSAFSITPNRNCVSGSEVDLEDLKKNCLEAARLYEIDETKESFTEDPEEVEVELLEAVPYQEKKQEEDQYWIFTTSNRGTFTNHLLQVQNPVDWIAETRESALKTNRISIPVLISYYAITKEQYDKLTQIQLEYEKKYLGH